MTRVTERKNSSFHRARATRQPYDVVLIVCEGAKTEPNYFISLKNTLKLSSANIEICGKECGSDPKSVASYAIKQAKERRIFDQVYCVFDKDTHPNYQAAIDMIGSAKLPDGCRIGAITSVPCFEFWLLLHFKLTTSPYEATGNLSPGEAVEKELRKYLPAYAKGDRQAFGATYPMINTALKNASRVELDRESAGTDNPSTKVHHLIEYLLHLKD